MTFFLLKFALFSKPFQKVLACKKLNKKTDSEMGQKSGQFQIFPRCLRENLYEELDERVLNDLEVPISCILLTTLQGGRVMTL